MAQARLSTLMRGSTWADGGTFAALGMFRAVKGRMIVKTREETAMNRLLQPR